MYRLLFTLLVSLGFSFTIHAQGQVSKKTTPKKKIKVEVDFSLEGGFYTEAIELELFSPGAKIYYTTDGTYPSYKRGILYKGNPIKIYETTPIRVVAYKSRRKSKIYGHTYFIKEPKTNLPVVSIQITPEILFDPERGLYVEGANPIDSIWSKPGANFWSKREKKCNIEIFESDNECEYRSFSGFRLFGGMSRLSPQKSITIVARDDYGKKRMRHRIFGEEGLKKFKFLVLRNSGSDFGKSHFRDAMITSLLEDWDIEKQDYRPSHVYINGEYWGIYNIREKINRYFLEDHCDIDKDSIDIMEHRRTRKRGSRDHYFNMLKFLEKNDLSDPANYAHLNSLMDIQNFMDYKIAQIYCDNQDAGGNIKYWRPRTADGRWRWIIYDTDWGFGLHDERAYRNNSLDFHLEKNGPHWPNPPWSTFILRKLMKNESFREEFALRFMDFINTSFETERVLKRINEMQAHIKPEIARHWERWQLEEEKWYKEIEVMREFAVERPAYMRRHLKETFNLGKKVAVEIIANKGGKVIVNKNIKVEETAMQGYYFHKIPIHLKATPNLGFRFSHWEGVDIEDSEFTLPLNKKRFKIRAVFESYVHPLAGKVIINEINCNYKKAGDWVEIYNNSNESISLENWVLTDDNNQYLLPKTTLRPKNYVIVCEKLHKFKRRFPDQFRVVGNTGFAFNKHREHIQLFTNKGEMVDSIGYDLEPRDSAFTLNLLLPHLDNADIENWEILKGQGTPGSANPYYLESRVRVEQAYWVRIGSFGAVFLIFAFLLMLKRRKPVQTKIITATTAVQQQPINPNNPNLNPNPNLFKDQSPPPPPSL